MALSGGKWMDDFVLKMHKYLHMCISMAIFCMKIKPNFVVKIVIQNYVKINTSAATLNFWIIIVI